MKTICQLTACSLLLLICSGFSPCHAQSHIRANQAGYHPEAPKEALVLSHDRLEGAFYLETFPGGRKVYEGRIEKAQEEGWGRFEYHYRLGFSGFREPGKYRITLPGTGVASGPFAVGEKVLADLPGVMLGFMRQQRCGYNPFLGVYCHQKDGRSMYGPMPDSTQIDARGGWHDAGDQLKYLITSSNATARMLMAWEAVPDVFPDSVDGMGRAGANGIPDILDEARWGLDWIHRMHPAEGQLFHQVADDRDHIGWKLPHQDSSDYGWGPGNARVVYYAEGKPQGLREYKSQATGIANLAGRCAAAMAVAARIWKNDLNDQDYAHKCLVAALDLYRMGKEQEGYQQGNSYGAPYRYSEDTWADDMEWAALELSRTTARRKFLLDAVHYAGLSAASSWMNHDSAAHYRYYPFTNVAHARLYPLVDERIRKDLAGCYRKNIEHIRERAQTNPYHLGVPFIWCSNNLVTAFVTQVLLYEQMTGDRQYHELMRAHLDWLFGRNPWGTSMFTGYPSHGEYPVDVHTSIWKMTGRAVAGGLVDGPVAATIYNSLLGLHLVEEDEFAEFQNGHVVYHDDSGDYSTNEPTMDGTADAIYMIALFLSQYE